MFEAIFILYFGLWYYAVLNDYLDDHWIFIFDLLVPPIGFLRGIYLSLEK